MFYDKYMHVKPRPPPDLDANAMGFWVGWSKMSNLDVMRETAMKGAQYDLACSFLAAKNKWDLSEARRWLKNEIDAWALDLLDRNQIFKAMHIYQNTGRDPYAEIMKIFCETRSQKLRENLFVHLEKNDKLTGDKMRVWNLFRVLEDQGYFDRNKICPSISYVMHQSDEWKSTMATRMFFETNDRRLANYVDPLKAWILLLKENPQLIDYWINVQYKRRVPIRFYNYNHPTIECLNRLFLNLPITEQMLDCLPKHNIPEKTQQMVFGELSKFGIFSSADRNDLKAILTHVIRINNMDNLRTALCKPSANVNLEAFSKLLIEYCLKNDLHPVLHECIENFIEFSNEEVDQYLEVMSASYIMCSSWTASSFRNSLIETSKYLSKNRLPEYFSENPFILLSILLFSKHFSLYNLLSTNTEISIEDLMLSSESAREILKTFDNLMIIFDKLQGNFHRSSLTHLDLLEKHGNITIRSLYEHRFANGALPHFNNLALSEKYGYKKEIDYRFFIKALRPCHAYKIFSSMQCESNLNQCYITSCDKVERFAMKKILSHEIVSSCITFIEMLNGKSYGLRMYLTTAEIIYKSKVLDRHQINNLFADIDMNVEEIYNYLQTALVKTMKKIKPKLTGQDFIGIINHFDVLVKFSTLHNLQPPDLILKLCTEQDLWLEFLIIIQMYNYPLSTVLKAIHSFKSPSIAEHLEHCFKNDIRQDEDDDFAKPDKNSKKYFFSKVGIRLSDNYAGSDVSSLSSYGSMPNSLESDILETEILNAKTDLLLLFLRCHNSMDPPKAFQFACRYYRRPLLAVFATCYEPDSMVSNWMTWLEVACNVSITHFNYDSAAIESESVLKCFRNVLMDGYFKTLYQSFFIFINENPLRYFMEFINGCLEFDFTQKLVDEKLAYFFKKMNAARRNSFVTEMTSDIHFVNNKAWIQSTAIFLLALTLQYGFKTFYDKILFLRYLVDINIDQYFANIACPNFQSILRILEHLFANSCKLTFDLSSIHNKKRFQEEIDSFIADLVRKKEFNVAINIAEISDLPVEDIVIQQAEYEFQQKKTHYWLEIEYIFRRSSVSPELAVNFFVDISERATNFDRYGMLEVAHSWARTHNLPNKHSVEKKVWLAFLDLEHCLNHVPLPDTTFMINYKNYSKKLQNIPLEPFVLNERQTLNLKNTMEALLSNGDLKRALKVEKIFGYSCHDLDILKLCLMLAEETVLPSDMTSDQKTLLSKRRVGVGYLHMKRTSTRLFSSSSSPNSPNTSKIENVNDEHRPLESENQTLIVLKMLAENVVCGASMAMKILRSYRCALNMNRKYRVVVSCLDPKKLLQEALSGDCKNKLEVIEDFIKIFNLSKQEIADLICAELVEAIMNYSKSIIDICVLWDVNIDSNFHVILQLLTGDCSILGMKLFALASATHQSQVVKQRRVTMDDSILIVELLIKAHDCFTADCNMEGISLVLKRCQTVFTSLFQQESWKLVIRLFTGIKRYSELGYVFPVLKDCGQFELLLRKGSRKDLGLKTALLDYLNRYCPDDVDLYKVVALHFFLFSEIADLWERESGVLIKRLIQVAKLDSVYNKPNVEEDAFIYFRNDEDTKKILKKIINNYRHASEYHLSGSKLSKAMKASNQAQLSALQLSLFKDLQPDQPCKCIFNLSNNQINSLLLGDLGFYQALIMIKAYGFKEDWAAILFEQYINKSKKEYLDSYTATYPVTTSLLHDISRKFMAIANPTTSMIENMKYLLNGFRSIHTKYRIASELGFMEIVEELLEGNRLCFLKDTVWKSGYRNTEE